MKQNKISHVEKTIYDLIKTGELLPGQSLPGLRVLAKTFNYSVSTIQAGIERLVDRDLLISEDRRGVFVAKTLPDYFQKNINQTKNSIENTLMINQLLDISKKRLEQIQKNTIENKEIKILKDLIKYYLLLKQPNENKELL